LKGGSVARTWIYIFLNNLEIAIKNHENEVLDIEESKFYETTARYGVWEYRISLFPVYQHIW